MTKFLKTALIAAIAISLVGCFDYAERLELNADGSGIISQHMVLYKDGMMGMAPMLQELSSDSSSDSSFSFIKRADVEKKLAKSGGSLKLIDFAETQTDSTAVYDIKVSFSNMDELSKFSNDWTDDEMMQGMAQKKEIRFGKNESGGWTFVREFGDSSLSAFGKMNMTQPEAADSTADSAAVDDPFADMGRMMMKVMKQAFAERTIKLTVKFPGEVAESNATIINGNEATWEYKLSDAANMNRNLEATIRP